MLFFSAIWEFAEEATVAVTITYYLVDDSVAISEIPAADTRKEACHFFRRQKMAKKFKPGEMQVSGLL